MSSRADAPSSKSPSRTSGAERSRPFTRRGDPQFGWAAGDARLDAWRRSLADWVSQSVSRARAVEAGNALLDFAQEHPALAPTPEFVCRRDASSSTSLAGWLSDGQRHRSYLFNPVHRFFEWYLDHHLSAADDHGRVLRSPGHFNPVPRRTARRNATESTKDPLPTRYLRELRQLLTSNDWAWAKAQKDDWIECLDTHTGKRESVWCPVRASALALKLLLPLRTFQVRMLDSGEGDTLVRTEKGWQPNRGPHAPSQRRLVRQGFLRRFVDASTGGEITGFFVNTNKTADRLAKEGAHGYEIPWEHAQAIDIVQALVRWQKRYNPIERALPWSEVWDPKVRLSGTGRTGAVYFLMRDPRQHDRAQPVSYLALGRLWCELLATLEERLAARGERRPDGSRIRLVRRGKSRGRKKIALFGLHSLRVSLLTALATEGAVPLHILSKVVAGHASIVMTLYYVKTNPTELTRCLSEASDKVDAAEQENFVRYLASEQRKEDGFVSNDAAGVDALGRSDAGLWKTLSTGICPVGGTRCGDGGPRIGANLYAPVPGGSLNCVGCRFHITGPAFLPGLVARFNAASLSMEGARRELREAEAALTAAENARFEAEQSGHAFPTIELSRSQSRVETAESRLASLVASMQATYQLIERSKSAARTHEGLNLVLPGEVSDLETAVRETTQLELWDAVCQAARIHPCSEVSEATLRRSQALDRLLARHGAPPLLMGLPDDVALAAGNELMRWMSRQVGRANALALLDGRGADALDVDGVVEELLRQLPRAAAAASSHPLEAAP